LIITGNIADTNRALGLDYESVAAQADGRFMSAFVRARKPLD